MRNLFYIEEVPSGLRAKIGASSNSSVEIYFDTLFLEEGRDYITFLQADTTVVAYIELERFNYIDKEVLSLLLRSMVYNTSELAFHYRKCGRVLRRYLTMIKLAITQNCRLLKLLK